MTADYHKRQKSPQYKGKEGKIPPTKLSNELQNTSKPQTRHKKLSSFKLFPILITAFSESQYNIHFLLVREAFFLFDLADKYDFLSIVTCIFIRNLLEILHKGVYFGLKKEIFAFSAS